MWQGSKTTSSINIHFNHYPPKGGYYYLTLVLLPKARDHSPRDSDVGVDAPFCQVRVRKRHIASKRAFLSAAKPKPMTLTWIVSGRRIYLDIYHAESTAKIPFEMCEDTPNPSVGVHVPPLTKRVDKTRWE